MRSTQLLSIAVQAEKIRLHRKVYSLTQRIVMSLAGSFFIVCALIFGEFAGYSALRVKMTSPAAALVAAAANLAVAVLFLLLAARHRNDRLAAEARLVRNNACLEIAKTFTVSMMIKRAAESLGLSTVSSTALGGAIGKILARFLLFAVMAAGTALFLADTQAKAAGMHDAQIITPSTPPVPAISPPSNHSPSFSNGAKSVTPEQIAPHDADTMQPSSSPMNGSAAPAHSDNH